MMEFERKDYWGRENKEMKDKVEKIKRLTKWDEEIEVVNLTPHEVRIFDDNGNEILCIPPSGQVARIKTEQTVIGYINGVPVVKTVFREVLNLPEPKPNTIFIVSSLVAQAVPHRKDIVAPDTSPQSAVRDATGNIIGVKRFQRW